MKQLNSTGENNSTRQHSKIKANAGEKQRNSSVGTKQLNSTGENNSTWQHERNNSTRRKTTQLSRKRTTQLVSRDETTQLCTAVDRLQSPATAYKRLHRLYSRIGFLTDVGSLQQFLLYADEHYLAGKLPLGDHLGKVFMGSKNIINVTLAR
ncbi:hypothetical protein TNCV_3787471 [Trichonephila clavipes]|nr:hypothetical protein TNCV_3787471 [Trichonephila clavipes]